MQKKITQDTIILDQYIKNRICDFILFDDFKETSPEWKEEYKKEVLQRLDELFYLRDNFNK